MARLAHVHRGRLRRRPDPLLGGPALGRARPRSAADRPPAHPGAARADPGGLSPARRLDRVPRAQRDGASGRRLRRGGRRRIAVLEVCGGRRRRHRLWRPAQLRPRVPVFPAPPRGAGRGPPRGGLDRAARGGRRQRLDLRHAASPRRPGPRDRRGAARARRASRSASVRDDRRAAVPVG